MSFSTSYFGKPLEGLAYRDIEEFFREEKEESSKIEFKSFSIQYGNFNKNLEGVIRAICAFLNSDGGIVIWGAPEGVKREGTNEKVFVGPLSPVLERKEKDALISKVSDPITPLPIGVNVALLEQDSRYVYVFEAQSSAFKPHQYKDTYWVRLDGQTKPAPHYLIEALFRRITYPNIEGYIRFDRAEHSGGSFTIDLTIVLFNFTELHNEENVSLSLTCSNGKFFYHNAPHMSHLFKLGGHQLVLNNHIPILHFGTPNTYSTSIVFNLSDVKRSHYQSDLILTFGGKSSPMKSSSYKLNIGKYLEECINRPNNLIAEKQENEFMFDRQKSLGVTKEHTLKQILGR